MNLILTSHDEPGTSDFPWLQVENEIMKGPGANCFDLILAEAELPAGLLTVTVDAALERPVLTLPNEIDVCESFSHAGVGWGVGVGIGIGVGLAVGTGVGIAVGTGVGITVGTELESLSALESDSGSVWELHSRSVWESKSRSAWELG